MNAEGFASRLRLWRRANMVKQASLAHDLGVTQAAVSRWENGIDTPSPALMRKLKDLLAKSGNNAFPERRLIERQSVVRALFDLDGTYLLASSQGMRKLWPSFAGMTDIPLADYLIGELAGLLHDDETTRSIRKGEVLLVTGVTERHLNLDVDHAVRHRWHLSMRTCDARSVGDLVLEPCDPAMRVGIDTVLNVHDLVA
jgi:transcriptional regulator with XRE-family HTH domain